VAGMPGGALGDVSGSTTGPVADSSKGVS
jgi:hypothetical protein